MSNLSQARMKTLEDATGRCNYDNYEFYVSAENASFTYEDIAILQDHYYNGNGETHIHMSDIPGQICWKSRGDLENRKFADAVGESCSSDALKNSKNGEAKCEALHAISDHYASETTLKTAAKIIGGLIGVWSVFGPGMSLWRWMSGGNGPQNPTSGTKSGTKKKDPPNETDESSSKMSMLTKGAAIIVLAGTSIAAGLLVADDATVIGILDNGLLVPVGAAMAWSTMVLFGSEKADTSNSQTDDPILNCTI